MNDDDFVLPDPRLRGIKEHYDRAVWFVNLSAQAGDEIARFRLLMAAVYPSRAIVELMLEAAFSQDLTRFQDKDRQKSRKQFEEALAPRLKHYSLVERIRIHDFHRTGCVPPDPVQQEVFLGGPIKLAASKGAAVISLSSTGPQVTLTGKSTAKGQRSLCSVDGAFYDDENQQYFSLCRILVEFLEVLPETISWFEGQMIGATRGRG